MSTHDKAKCQLKFWLKTYDTNRIKGLEQCRYDLGVSERSWREANCASVAFMAEFIRDVNSTAGLRSELLAHEFFKDDPRGPRKISSAAGRFILNVRATSGAEYELARSYGDLADYFATVDMEPQEVADELMRVGIAEFWRRIKAVEQEEDEQEGMKLAVEDHGKDDPIFGTEIAEVDNKQPRAVAKVVLPDRAAVMSKALANQPKLRSKPIRPRFDPNSMIMIGGPERLRRRVLGTELNEAVTVKLRCHSANGLEWKTLLIEDVIDDH